jgi:hypothetical protein
MPRLAVVSFVLNTILFASPDFKCGCRCRAYSTPDGSYTFSVTDPRYTNVVDGVNVWKSPLIDGRNQCAPPHARAACRSDARCAGRTTGTWVG